MRDASVPRALAPLLRVPVFEPGLVLEGGSIDVNGAGVVMTTEQCLLHPNRNPGRSRADLERALRDFLGVSDVLWLGEGVAGDDTDGHIDDIARFVSPRTIVCAVEDDPADPNYAPLQDNLAPARAGPRSGRAAAIRSSSCRCRAASWPRASRCRRATPTSTSPTTSCCCRSTSTPTTPQAIDTLSRLFPDRRVVPVVVRAPRLGHGRDPLRDAAAAESPGLAASHGPWFSR